MKIFLGIFISLVPLSRVCKLSNFLAEISFTLVKGANYWYEVPTCVVLYDITRRSRLDGAMNMVGSVISGYHGKKTIPFCVNIEL